MKLMKLSLLLLFIFYFGHFAVLCSFIDGSKLANELKKIKEDIGVDFMQDVFNKLTYKTISDSGEDLRKRIQDSLDQSLSDLDTALDKVKYVLTDGTAESTERALPLCCQLQDENLHYNAAFRQKVDTTTACITVSSIPTNNIKYPTQAVSDEMKSNYENNRNVLWQHYSTTQGVSIIYPATKPERFKTCGSFDPRFTSSYAAAAYPKEKDVVIVLETGSAMNAPTGIIDKPRTIVLAREAVYNVLQTLTPNDKVGIITFDSDITTPQGSGFHECYNSKLAFASEKNVDSLKRFIFSIQVTQDSNGLDYGKALRKAFQYFEASNGTTGFDNREHIIMFISAGPDTTGVHPAQIISEENAKLNNQIRIYTYLLSQDSNVRQMLQDMSNQVEIDTTKGPKLTGHFEEFDTTRLQKLELSPALATFYLHLPKDQQSLSVPYVDPFSGKGLITSRCIPIATIQSTFQGVVCTDVKISELLREVEFFSEDEYSYAFIVDGTGRAIMHPLLPNADFVTDTPVLVSISVLERAGNDADIVNVIESMKTGGTGHLKFPKYFIKPRGRLINDGSANTIHEANLYWGPVPRSNFSLCVVIVDRSSEIDESQINTAVFNVEKSFMYHQRSLVKESFSSCKFQTTKVTLERSSVKFSPNAYRNPYQYIDQDTTGQDVTAYTQYFTKKTDSNPGFKSTVRPMIWVTQKAEEFWKEKKARHVSWRYMGTKAGFIRVYPGSSFDKSYEHEKRPWWRLALAHPGKLVVTTPYVDALGSGVLMTIVHTISKPGTTTVTATVGADLPLDYFNYYIHSVYPEECQPSKFKCIIVDDSGFIVVNTNSLELPAEPKHITVEEKWIAEKMIAESVMSYDNECQDLSESKSLRSFRVAMRSGDPDGLSFSQTNGHFEIRPVADTNIFIVVVSKNRTDHPSCTCDGNKSPDVVVCNGCHCLCHRSIQYDMCSNAYNKTYTLPCSARIPDTSGVSAPDDISGLPQCFEASCSTKTTYTDCVSENECSWCEYTETGQLILRPCCRLKEKCTLGKARAGFSDTCDAGSTTPSAEAKEGSDDELTEKLQIAFTAAACLGAGVVATVIAIGIYKYLKRRRARADESDPYISAVAGDELKDYSHIDAIHESGGHQFAQPNPYSNPVLHMNSESETSD